MSGIGNKYVVVFKYLVLFFTIVLSFFNFGLSLAILILLNIHVIRRSVFGRLPVEVDKRPWRKVDTREYLHGKYVDIYYPGRKRPRGTILFAHGGGWISGYRRQPNNLSWYRVLVSRGFAVAAIEYSRGYSAGIEQLIDEFSAALWMLSDRAGELGLNEDGISVMGLSAGGHLALLAGMKNRELVKKIIAFYSPCDLLDIWDESSIFARFSAAAVVKRLPYKRKSRQVYRWYSPIQHITTGLPPVLLVHGMRDAIVPFRSSLKMFKELRETGCDARILLHPEGRHGFEFVLKDRWTQRIIEKTVEFGSDE